MDDRELRRVFTLASAFKEGDLAVGGRPTTACATRRAARCSRTTVGEIRRTPLVADAMTAALERTRDRRFDGDLDPLTVADIRDAARFRRRRLGATASRRARQRGDRRASRRSMTDAELSSVARALFNPLDGSACDRLARHFGSRIQPNSPGDDEQEILFSIFEGLSFGCGDVIIGLNPAADDVETIVRLERLLRRLSNVSSCRPASASSPTSSSSTRRGSTRGLTSLPEPCRHVACPLGMVGLDVDGLLDLARSFDRLYFETGRDRGDQRRRRRRRHGDTGSAHLWRRKAPGRAIGAGSGAAAPWDDRERRRRFIGPRSSGRPSSSSARVSKMPRWRSCTAWRWDWTSAPRSTWASRRRRFAGSRRRSSIARRRPYLMAVAGNADPMLGTSPRRFVNIRSEEPAHRRMTSSMEDG
jgi:hypothetical protein